MNKIHLIAIFALAVRLFSSFILPDPGKDYYWEYGELAKNLLNGNGYSLFRIDEQIIEHHYTPGVKPFISAYMPPGYVAFLLPFMLLDNFDLRNWLIYTAQIIISLMTLYLIYFFTKKLFGENPALIASFLFALIPEFIIGSLSFTPTVLYQLLTLLILYVLSFRSEFRKADLAVGLLFSLVIYMRSEAVVFLGAVSLMLFLMKKYRSAIFIPLFVLLTLAPWSIRNYYAFHQFVPLTTSYGLNLYRGNNKSELGYWGNPALLKEIRDYKNYDFELNMSRIYVREVGEYYSAHPASAVINVGAKFFYFWYFYPNYSKVNNVAYLAPAILILFLFIYGAFASYSWGRYGWFYLFFISSTVIAMSFMPLPRYQTMMKTAMLPFCGFAAYNLFVLLNKKKTVAKT